MSEDWEHARPYAQETSDRRWLPQLRADGQRVAWQARVALAARDDAEHYAAVRRMGFMRAARTAARARRVEDVELPEAAPDGPQEASAARWEPDVAVTPWDRDWAQQVPGTVASGPGFEATLHDRRPPFAVRWKCGHVHPDAGLAEVCALGARKALDRGERITGPRFASGGVVSPARPAAVRLTADADTVVTVKAHARSRVTVQVNGGGALEVTISGPESD